MGRKRKQRRLFLLEISKGYELNALYGSVWVILICLDQVAFDIMHKAAEMALSCRFFLRRRVIY
jgi:hypothetical protein